MAQTIGVTVQGQPVENGSTVTSYCLKVSQRTQNIPTVGQSVITSRQLDPEVYATSTPAGSYYIRVTDLTTDILVGMPNQQICWPTQCQPVPFGGEFVTSVGTLNGTPSSLQIDSQKVNESDPPVGQAVIPWPTEPFMIKGYVEIIPQGAFASAFSFYLNMAYDPSQDAQVEGVADDNNAPAEYFDLSGRRVLNPEKGSVLIERRGATVEKKVIL